MSNCAPILAYFAPETLLPMTSIVATIAGVTMMLGRGSLAFLLRWARRGLRRTDRVAGVSRPHFRVRTREQARSTGPR